MSPYELSILLDVFVGRRIREDGHAPIYAQTVSGLETEGWIAPAPPNNNGLVYARTPKLMAFIAYIEALPAPVMKWEMP